MFLVISLVFSISFSLNSNIVNADTTVGCGENKIWRVLPDSSTRSVRQDHLAPTSCEQTSYCKSDAVQE